MCWNTVRRAETPSVLAPLADHHPSELPQLRAACVQANVQAKITVVVVGKRHHVRFFPQNSTDADRSGNCPAGTVVDRDIVHPTEFDFYLQSHSG